MAIGRTSGIVQKALRGLEVGVDGLKTETTDRESCKSNWAEPGPERIWSWATPSRRLHAGRSAQHHAHRPVVPVADPRKSSTSNWRWNKDAGRLDYATLWELASVVFPTCLAFLLNSAESRKCASCVTS